MSFTGLKKYYLFPLLIGLFFCLTASRRWAQLISPQVWDEDGTQIIYYFMLNGWESLWKPVHGYMILVPKLISFISISVSFLYYPMVSTLLSFIFIALVGAAITLSPSKLKGTFFCALAVFLLPTNPETFGLPLYTFWWAGLLLFLLVLWDETQTKLTCRMVFLILGGLSSPVIGLVAPLLCVRAFLYRQHRAEILIAMVAVIIAAIQLSFMLHELHPHEKTLSEILFVRVPHYLGYYGTAAYELSSKAQRMVGIVLLLLLFSWIYQDRRNVATWFLAFLLSGAIALVAARVDLQIVHPYDAGPRYFFYPFILISWMLIQYWYITPYKVVKGILSALALSTGIAASGAWSRDHMDLHWREHVLQCAQSTESYKMPIEYDGIAPPWEAMFPGKRCAELLKNQMLP